MAIAATNLQFPTNALFDPMDITTGIQRSMQTAQNYDQQREKFGWDREDRDTRKGAGAKLAAGDYEGGVNHAMRGGMIDKGFEWGKASEDRNRELFGKTYGALALADTPEKYQATLGVLARTGVQIPDEYKDFNSRNVILGRMSSTHQVAQAELNQRLTDNTWDIGEVGRDKYGNPMRAWINKRTQEIKPMSSVAGDARQETNLGLSGEDYLKTLDAGDAATVKAIAEGRRELPKDMALKQPYWQKISEHLSRYEPAVDQNTFRTRGATYKDMATGKMGTSVASFNTALGHMHDLYKQIDGLGNLDMLPILNGPINMVKSAVDGSYQAKVDSFNATAGKVIAETEKAFKGMGATVSDMEHARADLNAAKSPKALKTVVKKYIDLMESRIEAIGDQYNRGMQLGKPRTGVSLLSPHTQEILAEMKGTPKGSIAGEHMMTPSVENPPIPNANPLAQHGVGAMVNHPVHGPMQRGEDGRWYPAQTGAR